MVLRADSVNKTKEIARSFSYIHSVDRIKIAEKLNTHREGQKVPQRSYKYEIMIVKNGITLTKVIGFCKYLNNL